MSVINNFSLEKLFGVCLQSCPLRTVPGARAFSDWPVSPRAPSSFLSAAFLLPGGGACELQRPGRKRLS